MALEVARRLIDGVWQTIVGEDSGSSPGGSSPFTMIGPVTVNFDDFGGSGGNFPVVLADIASGEMVIDWTILPTAAWTDASEVTAVVGIAPATDPTDSSDIGSAFNVKTVPAADGVNLAPRNANANWVRATEACKLIVYLASLTGTPSAGTFDVYAAKFTP